MTAHLLAQGRKRIAFLGNTSEHCPEFLERWQGYAQALATHGLEPEPALHVDIRMSMEEAGHAAIGELLDRGTRFDAVFAASDLIAIGALRELQTRGYHVPRDVAVAGFDDLPIASLSNPGLSTVAQNTLLAGRVLVDSLLGLINGDVVLSQTIPTSLALRGSTA